MIPQPTGDAHLYGGVYVKEMRVSRAGTLIPQHAHHYDHLSYLATGAVHVWQDGEFRGQFIAPAAIRIPAGTKHRFLTMADDTLVLCIHAVSEAEATFTEASLVQAEHQIEEAA